MDTSISIEVSQEEWDRQLHSMEDVNEEEGQGWLCVNGVNGKVRILIFKTEEENGNVKEGNK